MKNQREFKQTEIGKIPEEWEVVTLRDVVDSDNDIVAGPFGSNLKVSDYRENGIPIIRLQNIERNNFIYKEIKYVSQKKAKELKYHSFRAGDIVLAKLGDPIGKASIVPSSLERGIVVADVVRIRVSTRRVSSFFVEYILNSPICTVQLQKETIGTTRPRVNIFQIRNLKMLLPPLPEQKKIAEILSAVDQAIEKVDEAIEKTQRLKNGLMQELLTKGIGHKEFKETEVGRIPKDWSLVRLEEAVKSIKRGPFGGSVKKEIFVSKGYKVYEQKNVINNDFSSGSYYIDSKKYNELKIFAIKEGDILLTGAGTIGKIAVVPKNFEPGIINQALIKITLDQNKILIPYFYNLLIFAPFSKKVLGFSHGATMKNISSVKDLKSILIPLPPQVEQQKIAEILSTVDERLELLRKRKERLERTKKGLMNDLLTGKKRVQLEV